MNKTTVVENQTKDNTSGKPTKRIREEKPRKKDEKSVDHVLRALDSLGSTEEKLGAMCQKYAEMFNDHRVLQTAVKQAEKKNTLLQKEKEQLQAEHSKAILTRSRLENLCRELQRQNKAVKEECMLKMREEGEKKREVAAKFHSMLSEIGSLLAQNNDKNAKLRDDNLDMSMRLKSVCDQFEKKEQHVENLAKQMQLEMQLADAKLAKARMEMDIEKETLQKEKQQLLIELADYKRKLCEMKASELALREQITMYSEKYEEFHKALLQSNSAIGEFKAEMERMTKHIRRLEKETATWKSRYDAAQRTLTEVTQGKIRSDEALGLAQRRLTALQGICRGLQDQCRQLRGETRRDSQTDEDYKKLEAQIKEVEREDDLVTMPCSRRVSSGLNETVPHDSIAQANSETNEESIHHSNSENKDVLNHESEELSDAPLQELKEVSDVSISEPNEVCDSPILELSQASNTTVPVPNEINDVPISEPKEVSDVRIPELKEVSSIPISGPTEVSGLQMPKSKEVDVPPPIAEPNYEPKCTPLDDTVPNSEISEVHCPCVFTADKPNTTEKDLDTNNKILSDENIKEPLQENRLLKTPEISTNGTIDVSCKDSLAEDQSAENDVHKDDLSLVGNLTTPAVIEIKQSIEDSVNSLVNHIQEVSLVEMNPTNNDSETKANDKAKEEGEEIVISTCEKVPNLSNPINEGSLQSGVSLNSNPENNKLDFPNSNYCVMFGSVAGLSDEVTKKLMASIDINNPIKIDDGNQAKNKKKRKSKK